MAIPYGLLSSEQVRVLATIARDYDKDYGHITTRQNIQYNWPKLKEVPDILEALANVEMHAIQTSGNCIRNISADHFAGIAADEIEDPRPYCEIMRQWSTFHPEFSFLPRKFKIAFTGATRDRAAVRFHDIGYRVVENEAGERGFEVIVGGGMGRTPIIGEVVREFLPKEHLLSYTEAILRVYNLFGRRDNKYKARIKILVRSLGIEEFGRLVEEEWEHIKDSALLLTQQEIDRVSAYFVDPEYDSEPGDVAELEAFAQSNQRFARWFKRNVHEHKVPGYFAVTLSLKAPGVPPGDITADQLDLVADLAETYSFARVRTTHEQNLVFSDVSAKQLIALWETLDANALATPNVGTLGDMICCPGLDFCALANASSISVAAAIYEKFDDLDYLYDLGEIKLKMSGCINSCGHHHVGHIGILGIDKRGEEFYQVMLGGEASDDASLGKWLGPAIAKVDVPDAIGAVLEVYVEQREDGERLIDTYRRIGPAKFKERVYDEA